MKLSDAKRVVLFTLNSETNLVELRHYRITVKNLGISKSVKSIIQTKVPDLSGFDDISDYIMKYKMPASIAILFLLSCSNSISSSHFLLLALANDILRL